jgi:hypothetical protein
MSSPAPNKELQVALEAIRSDARVWTSAADEMNAAARDVASFNLDAVDFSYIGNKLGLTELYHGLQEKVMNLLQQGAKNFESTAHALNQCADDYQHADQKGSGDFGRLRQELPS